MLRPGSDRRPHPRARFQMALDDGRARGEEVHRLRERTRHLDAGRRRQLDDAGFLNCAFGANGGYPAAHSSTKGATGHTLRRGRRRMEEAIFTVLALQNGILPPTINQLLAGHGMRSRLSPERAARPDRSTPHSGERSFSADTTAWSPFAAGPTRERPGRRSPRAREPPPRRVSLCAGPGLEVAPRAVRAERPPKHGRLVPAE